MSCSLAYFSKTVNGGVQEVVNTTTPIPQVTRNEVSFLHGACFICQLAKSVRVIRAEIYENQKGGARCYLGEDVGPVDGGKPGP